MQSMARVTTVTPYDIAACLRREGKDVENYGFQCDVFSMGIDGAESIHATKSWAMATSKNELAL